MGFRERLTTAIKHGWNVFNGTPEEGEQNWSYGTFGTSSVRPDRTPRTYSNEKSIIASIFTRISIDVASAELRHVRKDNDGRYKEDIKSGLNECLTIEANLDQGASHFRQDIAYTLCDEGLLAVVPVETTINPNVSGGFDITNMRVGLIKQFHPTKVKVEVYNEKTNRR